MPLLAARGSPREARRESATGSPAVSPHGPPLRPPRRRRAGSCARGRAASLRGPRGRGRACSAPSPPPRRRLSHSQTAAVLTPNAAALSFCPHPCSCTSQARWRRHSHASARWWDILEVFLPPGVRTFHALTLGSVGAFLPFGGWREDLRK